MAEENTSLVEECMRQSKNCLYTAASFTEWLRWLKTFRTICLVCPLVFGALATWKIIEQNSPILAAVFALIAATITPIYLTLKVDEAISQYSDLAGEFTNLRDAFRREAGFWKDKSADEFRLAIAPLLERLEKARSHTLTPPRRFFEKAAKQIAEGVYDDDPAAKSRAARAAAAPN
jgi:hypothetical protein